jgi:hypothetical protein
MACIGKHCKCHCKCSLRERLIGDGCKYCNPAQALEYAEENVADLVERMRNWLKESAMSERITAKRCREFLAICDEFTPSREYTNRD